MSIDDQEITILKSIIRFWLISIKNGIFYQADHQINVHSVRQLYHILQQWFQISEKMELGFGTDSLYHNAKLLPFNDSQTKEIARYMHSRGILRVSLAKSISETELSELIQSLKFDIQTLIERGGIVDAVSALPNVTIEEVDYSGFLKAADGTGKTIMPDIWESLLDNNQNGGLALPQSSIDLFIEFFKDTHQAAQLLNQIYKKGLTKTNDEGAAYSIKKNLIDIIASLELNADSSETTEFKVNCLAVISHLPLDLIQQLFTNFNGANEQANLVDKLMSDMPENALLDFIESLIISEGSLQESLLSIFVKLIPDSSETSRLVPELADRLFQKQWIRPNTLTPLQISIQELFKTQPESNFLQEMYNITIDSVIHQNLDGLLYVPRLQPLVQALKWSAKQNQYLAENVNLILNLLEIEDKPDDFKFLCQKLIDLVPKLLTIENVSYLGLIFKFLKNINNREDSIDQQIFNYKKGILRQIKKMDIADQIISHIPFATTENFKIIGFILRELGSKSIEKIIWSYISQKNIRSRTRYHHIFQCMEKEIEAYVLSNIDTCESLFVRDYFTILENVAPDKCHSAALSIMTADSQLRVWEALGHLHPKTEKEGRYLLKLLQKEKNESFRKRITRAIIRSNNSTIIGELFYYIEHNRKGKKIFKDTILLCGEMQSKQTFNYLTNVLEKARRRPTISKSELIRVTAESLLNIHQQAAVDVLEIFINEQSRAMSLSDIEYIKTLISSGKFNG